MKGIDIRGEGLQAFAGTYKVTIVLPDGRMESAFINDHELGNVNNYASELIDEAMIDYTQAYATLSSFLMVYLSAKEDAQYAYKDEFNSRYRHHKSRPFYAYVTDLGNFKEQDKKSMLTDSHVKTIIEGEARMLELRSDLSYYTNIVMRLERSIQILEKAWDTARSLNANNRRNMGG